MDSNMTFKVNPVYRIEDLYTPKMISIVSSKVCAQIRIDDIEYIEQDSRQLHIYTVNTEYLVYESLSNIADVFSNRPDFYRPLKNLMINMRNVVKMENNYVYFESGRSFFMCRNTFFKTKKEFTRQLNMYHIRPDKEYSLNVAEEVKKT